MKKVIFKQKKPYNINTPIFVIICLFLFTGCKRLEMFAHTEGGTDTYCVYKISSVNNTGTMPALKQGDVVCLYCLEPTHCVLNTKRWIKVYEVTGDPTPGHIFIKKDTGISYELDSDDPSASCTNCPSTNKFELLHN
ncbi:MAG: hypothetical protein ICV81_12520 [Flavisolibacter sp.]|nr:hypothetical protein [Flavisolibacter sp.]MBD0284763.1 hypothetical protein [Flavisolibacter sp.]MBD0297399.1 hypothetical protein [Flavisolibacter sp.]MBD0351820.1 hypothetical protein [Flavisolibacter sp.]MBD0365666.1 hypothetical protein [Flavisolibacter sp.]